MAVVFAVRGTSKDARFAPGGSTGVDVANEWTVTADGTAINGSSLVPGASNRKALIWPGRFNTQNGRAFSILSRIKPNYSGAPAASKPLMFQLYSCTGRLGRFEIVHTVTTGAITATIISSGGQTVINSSFGNWTTNVSGTWYDLVFTWDGTTTANALKFYIDAVSLGTLTASSAFSASWGNTWWSEICLGDTLAGALWASVPVEEGVIWDSVITPSSVGLVSGTGSLNGAARTSLVDVAAYDGILAAKIGKARIVNR